jgi:Tfp pilus assembly protein PilF
MDPNFALAHNQLGQGYLQKQMYDEAVAEMRKALSDHPKPANEYHLKTGQRERRPGH